MYFDGEYRLIGAVDVTALADAVDALGVMDWLEDVSRQQTFRAHRKTQTIPLIYDADMRHTDPTEWPRFKTMQPLIAPIMDRITAYFAPSETAGKSGYFARIIIVRLGAGEIIEPHIDQGDSMSRVHRIHVPVITNDGAEFVVDRVVRKFALGEIWEINNRKAHAVRNHGDTARVHLILDYVLPGEIIADPNGMLVA